MANKKDKNKDLFDIAPPSPGKKNKAYTAADIEVLEGLEPVRRRPGMYIGGTDSNAMHHLFAEVIDNSMDEALAGHASHIEVVMEENGSITVSDNGRGIPTDPHPSMKGKSALEVIMTTLHAGGKFGGEAYQTSGGLHGVGISVVNALSQELYVEIARNQKLYSQSFSRGKAVNKMKTLGEVKNRRGTKIRFLPDPEIFGEKTRFDPKRIFAISRAKAYLFGGIEIRWQCSPSLASTEVPQEAKFLFSGGLADYLQDQIEGETRIVQDIFAGKHSTEKNHGSVEWACSWIGTGKSYLRSYCNTVPTYEGGTHEQGLRNALTKGIKSYGELVGNKSISLVTSEDIMASFYGMVSVFIREPEFQGQTKEKLSTPEASRIVEQAIRDPFDHWLAGSPQQANKLLEWIIDRAKERQRRKLERDISRKTAIRKLRLPGKLADCSQSAAEGSELFIVEGDSAGGSAKQARNRKNQAILPLRGKILNVASATKDKKLANQQLQDLSQALGCHTGNHYDEGSLRYERVIIMTDADVDGAHIASLLITFFHEEMPELIFNRHLYLAVPPLYRLSQGDDVVYAHDDAHREQLLKDYFKGNGKVEVSRFKGLGEMMPAQLRDTTMKPENRMLLQVKIDKNEREETAKTITELMGNKPELRFAFIRENAALCEMHDI